MKIENLKPSEIKPYFRNPRKNDNAIEKVAESIQAFGFQSPIIIDQENVIIAGHTRWKASLKLNLDKVPCIRTNGLSKEKIKAFRIMDNRTSELSEWDYALLKDEFEELDTGEFDLELTGFDMSEIEEMMTKYGDEYQGQTDDDAVPEDVEAVCKTGDLWKLGDHRLLCGDATKKEDVERLMDGKKVDILFTSPPYNAGNNSLGGNKKKVKSKYLNDSDNRKDGEWLSLLFEFAQHYISFLSKKSVLDLFLGSGSTLIACEKTNRKCYGMEIDPHYCDVIIKRWEDYTGNKAELINA